MMKKILIGVAVALVVLLAAAGGAYAYVMSATNARLTTSWDHVKGKDLPIPWPLTDAEIAELMPPAPAAPEEAEGDGLADGGEAEGDDATSGEAEGDDAHER